MSDTTEERRLQILRMCVDRQEFITLEDGFVYYDPRPGSGALSSYVMRWIADELDRINEPWQRDIDKYFENNSKCTCPIVDGIPVTGSSCHVHGYEETEW